MITDPEKLRDIELARSGDHRAFGRLVGSYGGLIHTLLIRMVHDSEIAMDLSQDTFIKAFTKLKTLREPSKFPSWICSTARRTALDHIRKRKVRKEVLVSEDTFVEHIDRKPELSAEGIVLLEQAVCSLSDRDRQLVTLAYFNELSLAEVGRIMGIPEPNVRVYLHRARKKLREHLRGHEDELLQQIG